MQNSTLDADGQKRLEEVLMIADGNLDGIFHAVTTALKGVTERARRIYLRNELTRRARKRIRARQHKVIPDTKSRSAFVFKVTPALRLDAWRHEQELCKGIPQEDR